MRKHAFNTALMLFAAGSHEFGMRDPLSVPDCQGDTSKVCNAWDSVLYSPDGDGGSGGGAGVSGVSGGSQPGGGESPKTFTQVDVDRMIQDRVKGLNEKVKASDAMATELTELREKFAAAEQERAEALEKKELEGKSADERYQHQLKKAADLAQKQEADWSKKLADSDARAKAAEDKHVNYVTRASVTEALVQSGALGSAIGDATLSFLAEAQIERDEEQNIKSIVIGGKPFEKPLEAARHFLTTKPFYVTPQQGGSGSPRHSGGPVVRGDVTKSPASDDFAVGYSARA